LTRIVVYPALGASAYADAAAVKSKSQESKMNKLAIPHDALVFVGDGRKALFLRNAGDEKFPNLKTERVFAEENPPTHEQGTDRPGRGFAHAGAHRRGNWSAWARRLNINATTLSIFAPSNLASFCPLVC
jgi:hypothetical protein